MSAHLIHKMKSTEKLKSNGRKRVLKIIQTERNKKISPTKMKNRQNIKTKKKMGRKKRSEHKNLYSKHMAPWITQKKYMIPI